MKQTDSQDWLAVVKQLFGHLRRVLREQLDRRFVFGLTLGHEMMTVWLHDRSGVIGTKTAIDIHKVGEIVIRRPWNINTFSPAETPQTHPRNHLFLPSAP